jgi:uncharacterized protein (TIGR02757 family)
MNNQGQTSILRPSLKKALDALYKGYDFRKRLQHDPVQFPHRYSDTADIELAGFIASCFAYGKVDLFMPVIEKILASCGSHPAGFLMDFDLRKDGKYLRGISYRFNKEEDVLCLMFMLSRILREHGSLKNLFYNYYRSEHKDIKNALTGFTDFFMKIVTTPVYGRNVRPDGLRQFFPSPESGSACKRMNLFLRWMVRTKDTDLGVWNKIPPSRLIIPLDTHIARIARCLGLTGRKTMDWKTAEEITASLKTLDARDPLKYDFALCHLGISRMCRGKEFKDVCSSCSIG